MRTDTPRPIRLQDLITQRPVLNLHLNEASFIERRLCIFIVEKLW